MRKVPRQKKIIKMTKGMRTPEVLIELSTEIVLQRSDPELIKAILCICNGFITFSSERLFSWMM